MTRQQASRPWDKDRDGFVMAEGAGVVVLEEYEHASKRGRAHLRRAGRLRHERRRLPHHRPRRERPGRHAWRWSCALKDAGVNADAVDYINAHGTSTPLGDLAETKAIKTTFGAHAKKLAVSSTKSQLGHLLGASGGVEAVITAMTDHRNLIPPTINLDNPDPECDLDYVPHKARDSKVNVRHEQQLRLRRPQRQPRAPQGVKASAFIRPAGVHTGPRRN